MASRPEGFRPVEAQGTLSLDTPGGRSVNLVAEGEDLRLEFEGWRTGPRGCRG